MIEIVKELEEANCVTHGGKFHSDEIFATVILSKILPNIKLIRVNEVTDSMRKSIANKLVYDIGGGEFDHHQAGGNGQRDNGVKYASCGLIWKSYGKKYLEKCNVKKEHIEELFLQIDKDLIQYIDANDNGQSTKIDTDYKFVELASVISAFNPCWNEIVDTDECFMQAYEIAKKYFERFIAHEIAKNEAKELVENAIENSKDGIMILEQFMPWEEAVLTSTNPKAEKINFVVFPSNRGGFSVHTVPKELGSFENRKSLPKEWAGLRDEKLQEVSKIKTAKFCHNACFICTAETKEDAIKMAEIAQRA